MAKVEPDNIADEVEGSEVARVATDVTSEVASLNNLEGGMYSSITGTDFASRKAVAAALTTSAPLDDHKGETINLANVIVQPVSIANTETGEVNVAPRVTLIDADNNAFHATSVGLLSSIRNILKVLGQPETWPEPVPVRVVEARGRNGYKFFTIEFV